MITPASSRANAARTQLLTAEARPPKSEVNADAIPDTIRQEERWVCWQWKRTKSKWTKRPVQADGKPASSTDAATWTTFTAAMLAYQRSPDIAGIGFVLGDGFAGVDLDGCVDPESGEADGYVTEVCERLDSYSEINPSKTGIKILVTCRQHHHRDPSSLDDSPLRPGGVLDSSRRPPRSSAPVCDPTSAKGNRNDTNLEINSRGIEGGGIFDPTTKVPRPRTPRSLATLVRDFESGAANPHGIGVRIRLHGVGTFGQPLQLAANGRLPKSKAPKPKEKA